MRYRACPCCQEVLPATDFFSATNPDPMHTPLCGHCLGVFSRPAKSEPLTTLAWKRPKTRAHPKSSSVLAPGVA